MGPTRGSTVSKASLIGEVCTPLVWGAAGESVQVQDRPAAHKPNSTCSLGMIRFKKDRLHYRAILSPQRLHADRL